MAYSSSRLPPSRSYRPKHFSLCGNWRTPKTAFSWIVVIIVSIILIIAIIGTLNDLKKGNIILPTTLVALTFWSLLLLEIFYRNKAVSALTTILGITLVIIFIIYLIYIFLVTLTLRQMAKEFKNVENDQSVRLGLVITPTISVQDRSMQA